MNDTVVALRLRQLLMILSLVLTFEGIARKAAPAGFGVPLFLLKDVIILIMFYYVIQMPAAPAIAFLRNAYKVLIVLFLPVILCTGWHDVLLAIFGAKQYLLYPVVGFATFHAFEHARKAVVLAFFRRVSLLLIPTTVLALLQLRLPNDHWLNMSVSGESLAGFSAAGMLRVSSTFSFVAQYCAFLNAQAFILAIALADWRKRMLLNKILGLALVIAFVLSCFATGSRTSVAGNTSILFVAFLLVLIRFRVQNILQIGLAIVALYFIVLGVNHFSPDTTAAYAEREGHLIGFSGEIQDRLYGAFFHVADDKSLSTFFGNGLGVMSNGSDTFSDYAAAWRGRIWTETDFASTLFEGGIYLAVVWYGFRLYVILITTLRFLKEGAGEYLIPLAFTEAFVIVIGVTGNLALQPPIAIWWWLGVGTSLLFWWKAVAPPEPDLPVETNLRPPIKRSRGRSLYAEALHKHR